MDYVPVACRVWETVKGIVKIGPGFIMIDSKHFIAMLEERNIPVELVNEVLSSPDHVEDRDDGTRHYIKKIENLDNRWLRVVVNIQSQPPRRVTAFFDRRMRKRNENKIG